MPPSASDPLPPASRLEAHLRIHLGQWPPRAPLDVVGSPARDAPDWDGAVRAVVGVATPEAAVLSVPPRYADAVRSLGAAWRSASYREGLNEVFGYTGDARRVLDGSGVFRWSTEPAPMPDAGEWVERDDPRVPEWLRPFNGGVLCAWDDDGRYGAGVGLKRRDGYGEEIAVGTEPALRGRGIARRLVATAAREVLRRGAVPTYVHAPDNIASARVAEAAGFPDRGWRALGFWRVQPG